MINKLGRVANYHEGLPHIKWHGLLIKWSFYMTWQSKTIVLLATNFGRMVTCPEVLLTITSFNNCGLARLHCKQKQIYLEQQCACGYQTWQDDITYFDGLLPIRSRDPLITLHFEIKWQAKHYISKTTVPMANKRGSMVTYLKWLPLIKLYDPLITLALLDHLSWGTLVFIVTCPFNHVVLFDYPAN